MPLRRVGGVSQRGKIARSAKTPSAPTSTHSTMKYLALSLLSLAAFVGVAQGINCWVCEDAEGNRAPCDGTNEQDKACGAYTIGELLMNCMRCSMHDALS